MKEAKDFKKVPPGGGTLKHFSSVCIRVVSSLEEKSIEKDYDGYKHFKIKAIKNRGLHRLKEGEYIMSKEVTIADWSPELIQFIKNYTPTGWTETIGSCCFVPFTKDYYNTKFPWYINQAIEAFKESGIVREELND
jgi:hypothetical protein